jgi:hypothetical protein
MWAVSIVASLVVPPESAAVLDVAACHGSTTIVLLDAWAERAPAVSARRDAHWLDLTEWVLAAG